MSRLPSDEALAFVLAGDFRDPDWRALLRDLIRRSSTGPFVTPMTPNHFVNDEPSAYVTNASGDILLDCGSLEDLTSCIDAIVFAASSNAIHRLLNESVEN